MASCYTPYGVRAKLTGETIPVPCGKCPSCTARRVSAWSFRLCQEDTVALSSLFITLTYDTRYVPITQRGFMTISKRDVQLFLKRLRKAHTRNKIYLPNGIKYFCAAEYGTKSFRPHYHLILFNADQTLICPAWGLGDVHYGQVSGASVGYTLKYISKGQQIPMHANDDRTPEFRLMSKRLGASYLSNRMVEWHKASLEDRMYCNLTDGKKISMPRYYKDKIYTQQERERVAFFTRLKMIEEQNKRELEGGDDYFRNLAEAHLAAFRRMKFHSLLNDKL